MDVGGGVGGGGRRGGWKGEEAWVEVGGALVSGCASRLVWTSAAPHYERAWANGRSQRGDVAS